MKYKCMESRKTQPRNTTDMQRMILLAEARELSIDVREADSNQDIARMIAIKKIRGA